MFSIPVQQVAKSRLPEVDFDHLPFGHTFSDHMFIADYKDGEWGSFRIVPYGDIPLSPANMALHYGQSIFEGMKAHWTVNGYPAVFRPKAHLDRLNRSAKRMAMPEVPQELFFEAIETLLRLDADWIPRDPKSALYIRPILFATDGFLGVKASETYSLVIMTGPTGPYYAHPVRLLVEEHYVRASRGGVGFAKAAGNYAASIMPAAEARRQGFDQILWLDGVEYKYIQECGTMNIFAIVGDTILTPETSDSILAGVTRDSLIELWREQGAKVEVRPVAIAELVEAQQNGTLREMFGSGTAAVISHVTDFSYQGQVFALPSLETRHVAQKMKEHFEDIKAGIAPDTHGWLHPVLPK
jgi:branched-chain amino acid aminotransferase